MRGGRRRAHLRPLSAAIYPFRKPTGGTANNAGIRLLHMGIMHQDNQNSVLALPNTPIRLLIVYDIADAESPCTPQETPQDHPGSSSS